MVNNGKRSGYDQDARLELLENDVNHKLEIMNMRLTKAEESNSRLEERFGKVEAQVNEIFLTNQKIAASIVDVGQKIGQVSDMFGLDGTKDKADKARRIWERVADKDSHNTKFWEGSRTTFIKYFWPFLGMLIITGMVTVISNNHAQIEKIKEAVSEPVN